MARFSAHFALFLAIGGLTAKAAAIDNQLVFSGTGTVGPGHFSFDSMGVRSVVLDPPVSFPSFQVWVSGNPFIPMSPQDDALQIGSTGFVSALNADVSPAPLSLHRGESLQLTEDLKYQLFGVGGTVVGSGTYAIIPTPEPEWLFCLSGLLLVASRWRRRKI